MLDRREELSLSPFDKIYWLRVAFGILTGLTAGLLGYLGPVQPGAERGVILAIAVYAITYYIGRYRIAKEIKENEVRKVITSGLGSYIILFLFTWILYNTLISA